MDPATGALTLLGATISVARAIERIRTARDFPKALSTIFAEVADLQRTLEECNALELSDQHSNDRLKASGLFAHVEDAKQTLKELEKTLGSYTLPDGLAPAKKIEEFWTAVIRGKRRVDQARDDFRKIRERLGISLQAITAPTVVAIHSSIKSLNNEIVDLSSSQKGVLATQQEILQYVLSLTAKARDSEPPLPPSYHSIVKNSMTRNLPETVTKPIAGLQDSVQSSLASSKLERYCTAWCSCCCHAQSSIDSPLRSLSSFIGALSISYSGLPGIARGCNETLCRGKASPSLRVSYDFPRAIAQRRLMFSCTFSMLAGPELRVRLPRVVDWTSPLWPLTITNNVTAVRTLFANGLASPWDVSPLGGNLLHYATDRWNAEFCSLLLEAGVDPSAEDLGKKSAVGIAWERVLMGKMSRDDASTVASLFKDTDYLSTRAFTAVHKIVLGLVSSDLDAFLSISTGSIDTGDSKGLTPLAWAVARGDETTVSILLKHGANPNIADVCGNVPLHHVRNTACAQLLFHHGAKPAVVNNDGSTPLHSACRNGSSASLVRFLITSNRSADVNKADRFGETPLHVALSCAKYLPLIDVLLDAGADINARNGSSDSPLRFAILWNLHLVLARMLAADQQAKFDGINIAGQGFAHTIARTADVKTVKILTEARPHSLTADFDLHDLFGKTSLDYFEERLALLEITEQTELRDAFNELIKVVEEPPCILNVKEILVEEIKCGDGTMGSFEVVLQCDRLTAEIGKT